MCNLYLFIFLEYTGSRGITGVKGPEGDVGEPGINQPPGPQGVTGGSGLDSHSGRSGLPGGKVSQVDAEKIAVQYYLLHPIDNTFNPFNTRLILRKKKNDLQ